jgi:diguanylate cyclase
MLIESIISKYFLGKKHMEKDDLKSLVTQMYNNLLEKIDQEEEASREQVITYLKESADVISAITDSEIDSAEHAKSLFSNAYKELTDKSIASYKNTNTKFEKIAQMHEQTINECQMEEIDLGAITEKFNDIQTHMTEEIKKANAVINTLTNQVKILEETTNLDSLTKVFNRRALSTYLEDVCARDNSNNELHVLILDIDDFKDINDKHGHIAGDKVLIFIANIFRKTLRDGDKVFRYGGEEFIIILNRIDEAHCKKIADRLLDLVRTSKLIYKGKGIHVTMSIGTTKYESNDTPDTLIARADKALYRAKKAGKNQMCSEGM